MTARQRAWPRQWLMTDERMGERLWEAIDRLPIKDGGIVFRHYRTPAPARVELARRVADICRERSLVLGMATDAEFAQALGADFAHNPSEKPVDMPFSRAVHSLEDAEAAKSEGASLVFVSPLFPTRSHPGAATLDQRLATHIAKAAGVPAIALGGMDAIKWAQFKREGFYGWAGIDAWLRTSA